MWKKCWAERIRCALSTRLIQHNTIQSYVKKANDLSQKIRWSYLSRYFVSIAVNTTIMKSLGYPLAALTLTEKQCDCLMKPIVQASLPKMGIVRNICKKILIWSKGGTRTWISKYMYWTLQSTNPITPPTCQNRHTARTQLDLLCQRSSTRNRIIYFIFLFTIQ